MNKGQFIKAMADKSALSQKDANAAYEAMLAVVTDALRAGDKIQLPGFGTFELRAKAAREGFNPSTHEKVKIPATKAPALKFGKAYKDLFN